MSRPASILPWCGTSTSNGFVTASFKTGGNVLQTTTIGTVPTSSPPPQGNVPTLNLNTACRTFTDIPPANSAANAVGDEFVGPFGSWADVRRDFHAVGDGVADDTAALQAALSAVTKVGNSPVLYLPAGTYRVASTLTAGSAQNISIIGQDPRTTILKWAGPSGGTLLHIDGIAYSKFDRLTFDGSGNAGVLVDQSLTGYGQGQYFDTGNEYADDVFQNAAIGIQGGQYGLGAAETSVLRSTFLNHSTAGIILKNFNALDWWIWYSYFQNNQYGITNNPGAGNFHAYNNVFQASAKADLEILNTGTFNFRENFSINSNRFLNQEYFYTNAAVTRLQGNTIITPSGNDCNGCAIMQGNMGPTIMTDNTFVSPSDATWPTVIINSLSPPDCVSVGDTFTNSNSIACQSWPAFVQGRLIQQDDQIVPASSVSQSPPILPGVLPNYNRKIFDVAIGSGWAAIQQAIQQAAGYCGQKPVVHLPYGNYSLSQSLIIPANCDIQFVGDGGHTALSWAGGGIGPVVVLQGPSRATLRDFYVNAGSVTGIEVQNADQQGSRIYMQQPQVLRSSVANVFVDGLDYTNVELHNFNLAYTAIAPALTGVALKVSGGPLAQRGMPQNGGTKLFAGSMGANYVSYQANNGGNLLVRDAWYEGSNQSTFAQISDNSSFTVDGSRIALPASNGDAFQFNNLSCSAVVSASAPDSDVNIGGGNGNVWILANNFNTATNYLSAAGGSVQKAFNLNRSYTSSAGSSAITDITAVPDTTFIRAMLAQSRMAHPSLISDLVAGVTDVRFYRISVELGTVGIHLAR
jgi:hypothetical protein